MATSRHTVAAAALMVALITGCGSAGASPSAQPTRCERAVLAAAAIPDDEDQVTDLDQAIRDCVSYDQMRDNLERYAEGLGIDPADFRTFVDNRCFYEQRLTGEEVCQDLGY